MSIAPHIEAHRTLLLWSLWLSAGTFLLVAIAIPVMVAQLPSDYFRHARRPRPALPVARLPRYLLVGFKNVLGAFLIGSGLIMLLVPGQGLLAILAGLLLTDFPGKYRLECWLARRPPVWRALVWIRRRTGQNLLLPPTKPNNP